MQRRSFLAGCSFLPAAFAVPRARAADAYPARPIQVVVPYAAGGADTYIRPLQPVLEREHGIKMVVETVVGAGGTIGSARVKRSPPDGYALLFCGSGALTIAPELQQSAAPTPAELTAILNLTTIPYVIAVRNDSPIRDAAGFIDFIQRHPGTLNYGSPGTGSAPHLGMEALALRLHTSMVHVPFPGISAAVQQLLGGHLDSVIGAPSNVLPQIRAGALRGIAVTSRSRFPFAKELPTLAERGVDVDVSTHFGFFGPPGLDATVVRKLAAAIREAAGTPAYAATMAAMQTPVDVLPADALLHALAREQSLFEPVIAGLRKK